MLLQVLGIIGHFIALPFCDLTLIACNSGTAILINAFISKKFLGEKFVPKNDVIAILCVSAGTVFIVFFSNKE